MPYFPLALVRNIRDARKNAKLTQGQVAEKLGITPLHYGRLERGERQPSLSHLSQIADVLGVSAYDLIDGCFPSESTANHSYCESITRLVAACPQEGQRLIQDICWIIAHDHDI